VNAAVTVGTLWNTAPRKTVNLESAILAICESEIEASVNAAVTVNTRAGVQEFSSDEVLSAFAAQGVEQIEYNAKVYEPSTAADDWSMV
jgi:hypothetical protein